MTAHCVSDVAINFRYIGKLPSSTAILRYLHSYRFLEISFCIRLFVSDMLCGWFWHILAIVKYICLESIETKSNSSMRDSIKFI